MTEPEKGGRGKKPYYGRTVAVRVPEGLINVLDRIVVAYKEAAKAQTQDDFIKQLEDVMTQVCYPNDDQSIDKHDSLIKAVQVIQEKVITEQPSYKEKSAKQLCADIKSLDLDNK